MLAKSAFSSKDGRKITLGAGLTNGKAGGIVGSAVARGLVGHLLSPHKKHYHYA